MSKVMLLVIALRLALGGLFIYGGVQKFIPKPPPQQEANVDLHDHVVKIKAFIGGLKQTGYFWPMLGMLELICGILLMSQVLSLLGAVMLVPITLNILLFHAYLKPHDIKDLILTTGCFLVNLLLIAVDWSKIQKTFFNFQFTLK